MSTLQENQSLNAEYERNKKEREMKEEIERLNNIIKKAINIIQERIIEFDEQGFFEYPRIYDELLSTLKGDELLSTLRGDDNDINYLKSIINKAIEFIEKYQIERKVKIANVELDKSFVNSQGVLDILKGEDK